MTTPDVIIAPTAGGAAERAADLVESYVRSTAEPVLGLATGATMRGVYDALVCRSQLAGLSFAGCRAFLLDEYVGLAPDDPNAYANVIEHDFAGRVDFAPHAVRGPDGTASDTDLLDVASAGYDAAVRTAGIGVQLLGIGRNGHLAFNEPGSPFDSRTRVVDLAPTTRVDNARFFERGRAPGRAVTQGLGTILEARHLVLIALGVHKAEALHAALRGPIDVAVPASAIRLHPRVTVIADAAAASLLSV